MTILTPAVRWIGLRDRTEGLLAPFGLGQAPPGDAPGGGGGGGDGPLRQGTIQAEYRYDPAPAPRSILKFSRRDPVPVSLTMRGDPDGTLILMLRHGQEDRLVTLDLPPCPAGARLNLQYGWDLDGELGYFYAEIPSIGHAEVCPVPRSIGFSMEELGHLMTNPAATRLPDDIVLLAAAEGLAPIGPLPGLDGEGRVDLADGGSAALAALRPGTTIIAADGHPAQIRWIGHCDQLALGHAAPFVLHPPYFGARRELRLAGSALLRVGGAEVDYLFGCSEVTVRVRHLADRVAVEPMSLWRPGDPEPVPVWRYHQVLLDRPVPLRLSGIAVETLRLDPLLRAPEMLIRSVLRAFPPELLSLETPDQPAVLREFEAQTLRQMQAA